MVTGIGSLFGRIPFEKIMASEKNVDKMLNDENEDSDSETHATMFLR